MVKRFFMRHIFTEKLLRAFEVNGFELWVIEGLGSHHPPFSWTYFFFVFFPQLFSDNRQQKKSVEKRNGKMKISIYSWKTLKWSNCVDFFPYEREQSRNVIESKHNFLENEGNVCVRYSPKGGRTRQWWKIYIAKVRRESEKKKLLHESFFHMEMMQFVCGEEEGRQKCVNEKSALQSKTILFIAPSHASPVFWDHFMGGGSCRLLKLSLLFRLNVTQISFGSRNFSHQAHRQFIENRTQCVYFKPACGSRLSQATNLWRRNLICVTVLGINYSLLYFKPNLTT